MKFKGLVFISFLIILSSFVFAVDYTVDGDACAQNIFENSTLSISQDCTGQNGPTINTSGVTLDCQGMGKYGRTIAKIYMDGEYINDWMIAMASRVVNPPGS